MADVCNHTWVPECGFNVKVSKYKLFLDACDMYEYNCDKLKDYEVVTYAACLNKPNDCPACKPCKKDKVDVVHLREMEEVADSVWKKRRRYTPEVLKIRKMLRKMQAALESTTNSPKMPTRTTRSTYEVTVAGRKALQSADHVDFLAWKMYRHRTPMARPRPRLRLVHDVSENHPSISTIYYAASEIESTTTAAATTATTETEILKSETVVKFGHKFLKVVKKIRKN